MNGFLIIEATDTSTVTEVVTADFLVIHAEPPPPRVVDLESLEDLVLIQSGGPPGPQGPQGPTGASGSDIDDIPSLTLIFENGLV